MNKSNKINLIRNNKMNKDNFIKMLKERKQKQERLNKLDKERYLLMHEIGKYESKIDDYIFKNKLYIPIKNLKQYEGRDVYSITLIDDKGNFEEWGSGEISEVKDGHYYYSDYNNGIYEYSTKDRKYHNHCCHSRSAGDKIIGYIDLELSSGFVKESKKEYIVEKILTEKELTKEVVHE